MEYFSITNFTREISSINLIGLLLGHIVFAIALTQLLDWTWLKNLMSEEDKIKMLNSYTWKDLLVDGAIIAVVIGEGASGGALGVGICDKMFMLENTWYSVISPEGCASILWRDASKAPEAADAMKVTPEDLVEMGICDEIIKEPVGGAHREFEKTVNTLKTSILLEIKKLESIDPEDFLDQRISRYEKMGKISD